MHVVHVDGTPPIPEGFVGSSATTSAEAYSQDVKYVEASGCYLRMSVDSNLFRPVSEIDNTGSNS